MLALHPASCVFSRPRRRCAAQAAPLRFVSSATLALLAMVAGMAAPGFAQTPCEAGLKEAEKSYELGLFAAVPDQLQPCFKPDQRTRQTELAQAYSLLARAYLAADETAKARQAVSDLLRADPTFEPGPPPRFARLVAQVRREESTVLVASVSKTNESLREAPATVMVITAEEIERRGYLDLEQLLHDLPGFDISRTRDINYSTIFLRGFRSQGNDRNLLLLDGLEQNDLSTNTVYLSRQYPLSDIDRVEVIYGPASTMYGAGAFTGVINIISKEPEALVAEDKRLGLAVQAAGDGSRARYADLTLAGKNSTATVSWSLASRLYRSDEMDLSRFAEWKYDYDAIDYKGNLRLTGNPAQNFLSLNGCPASLYYACRFDAGGKPSIELTDAGERLIRGLDQKLVQDNRLRFFNRAEDWSVYGKVKISNLTVGVELWRTQEGNSAIGSLWQDGHSSWAPRQTLLYLKYARRMGRDLSFNAFTRYQQSGHDGSGSRFSILHTYANGLLGIWNLLPSSCFDDLHPLPASAPGCPGRPWVYSTTYDNTSSKIRSEFNLVYEPSPRLSAVGGIELSKSSVQSAVNVISTSPPPPPELLSPPPGVIPSQLRSEQIEHTDLAAYAQASYKLRETLKLVLAGRVDYDAIDNRSSAYGLGALFSPRAAVVYTPAARRLVLKAIYSEAFKDPTDAEKFGVNASFNGFESGGLRPEKVRNFELSAGWQPNDELSVAASVYQARYSGLVALRRGAGCSTTFGCFQYYNHDDFRIRGLQVTGRYRLGKNEISGNYTFTAPFQTNPLDGLGNPLLDDRGNRISELRIGDIASQRANLGVNRDWAEKLNTDLRLRYVGPRRTGPQTTDFGNPLDRIPSYLEAQLAVSYKGPLPGTTLQLIVTNLFDRAYFDPGTVPLIGVARVPQAGRTIYFRILTGLFRPAQASEAQGAGAAPASERGVPSI